MIASNKLTAAICMGNEADKYLEEVLTDIDSYVDQMVIMDDATTDESNEIANSFDKATVYRSEKSYYSTAEYMQKTHLWKEYLPRHVQTNEWVLAIDCDEIIDPRWKPEIEKWLNIKSVNNLSFRCIEAWGSRDMIRVDGTWNPSAGKDLPMLARYLPQVNYVYEPTKFHTRRIPMNHPGPLMATSYYFVHLGWANERDIKSKRRFYKEQDKDQTFQPLMDHYQSMYEEPTLVPLDTFIPGGIP